MKNFTHKQREALASMLLTARGWASCFLPFDNINPDCIINGVRAGNLQGIVRKIDEALKLIRHRANGVCRK